MKTANNPFFIEMQKGAEEAAKRLNVELVVQAAEREVDVEKQMQIIENLIQTRVAALCVTPSGSREIVPAIDKANRANIPVVIVDTRVDAKALSESGGKCRDLHRLGQLRGRQARGRVPGEEAWAARARSRCSKASRATRRATRGCAVSATL